MPAACSLATADATMLLANSAGGATVAFAIPGAPSLVGTVLRHQVIEVELTPSLQITRINSSNGLVLTAGVF